MNEKDFIGFRRVPWEVSPLVTVGDNGKQRDYFIFIARRSVGLSKSWFEMTRYGWHHTSNSCNSLVEHEIFFSSSSATSLSSEKNERAFSLLPGALVFSTRRFQWKPSSMIDATSDDCDEKAFSFLFVVSCSINFPFSLLSSRANNTRIAEKLVAWCGNKKSFNIFIDCANGETVTL